MTAKNVDFLGSIDFSELIGKILLTTDEDYEPEDGMPKKVLGKIIGVWIDSNNCLSFATLNIDKRIEVWVESNDEEYYIGD